MAATLCALRNEDVGTMPDGIVRLIESLDLTDQKRAALLDLLGMWLNLAKREHDCRRPALQNQVEKPWLFRHAPRDEAHANACVTRGVHLTLQPGLITVTAADYSKASRTAHRRCEPPVGDNIHRRQQDWVLHAKKLRQTVSK